MATGCEACLLKQRYVAVRLSCRECAELHKIERLLRADPYAGVVLLERLLEEVKA